MSESEKLCLQWNDFKGSVIGTFGSLCGDKDFADVTLLCEDGVQFEAHRVVLASSSPYFDYILRRGKHPNPLIYMRSLNSKDISALLDFLYLGEANIYQENLDKFLALAGELQLKGLTGTGEKKQDGSFDEKPNPTELRGNRSVVKNSSQRANWNQTHLKPATSFDIAPVPSNHNTNIEDLEEQINSLLEESKNMIMVGQQHFKASICKACGKEGKKAHIREHIEIKHIAGSNTKLRH